MIADWLKIFLKKFNQSLLILNIYLVHWNLITVHTNETDERYQTKQISATSQLLDVKSKQQFFTQL